MEMNAYFAASSSNPISFFNPVSSGKQFSFPDRHPRGFRRTTKPFCVKSSGSSRSTRQTLSSNWDVNGLSFGAITPSPSWFPRFEELDTTNMPLRQRIVFLGMGIYDAMKQCKADVSTVCLGLAASMGAFLLASGSKGKRFCMPDSKVMIHQLLGTAGGEATEMSIRIREMMYRKIKLNKISSRIRGKPESQIEVDTDRDNFLNPWEAKEYGLIDVVIDDGKPGLIAPTGDDTPPPKTRVWDLWKAEGTRKGNKNLPSEHTILQNE